MPDARNDDNVQLGGDTRIEKTLGLQIPRCISPGHTEGELHVFVDASEKSYAAAVYWRIKLSEHESAVSLIAGKARVAPLKVISIPRLELQAALLGARLASSVLTEIELNVTRKIFWTDSRTVLSWIRSDPRSFKLFVAHRLAELEEHTTVKCWRWVPTKLNVADDATRDPPTHFDETHRWFHGPDFLRKSEDEWPQETVESERPTGEERSCTTLTLVNEEDSQVVPNVSRFSSWTRLLRSMARVLQAIDLFRVKRKVNALKQKRTANKTSSDPTWKHISKKAHTPAQKDNRKLDKNDRHPLSLNCDYIRRAETLLLLEAQKCFERETTLLREGKAVTRRSRLRKFAMEIDENGVLRLKGRIKAGKDGSFTLNRPAVLSGDSSIAKLIVRHYHVRNYEKSPTNVNGAKLTEVCRKYRLRRVICLPNAYVITNPPSRVRGFSTQYGGSAPRRSLLAEVVEGVPPTLVPAGRGDPICRAPAEGDIVLIVDPSSPRYSWPRGRIKKTYPGPDNQVRVVDVETTGGVLRRPISKIVVLVSAEATAVPCPEV
ncbi:hypothetical protein EVAR_77496_1 [Eumeta japonica]|uniref:DUF5641 domain-containing protein n=1 Tax=Eumeta variegata TaxID=151549 RepID=A0A4C1T923_EUMVA|nr:hypothetical protein EVAR_77496_1 [Eumeta japonica]